MKFDLPFPPSTNTYWRNVRGRTLLSAKGRAYKVEVRACVLEQHGLFAPLRGPLMASVQLQLPDKRRRDIDNFFKGLFDAMGYAQVYDDDSQIMELHAVKIPAKQTTKGRVIVTIEQL